LHAIIVPEPNNKNPNSVLVCVPNKKINKTPFELISSHLIGTFAKYKHTFRQAEQKIQLAPFSSFFVLLP